MRPSAAEYRKRPLVGAVADLVPLFTFTQAAIRAVTYLRNEVDMFKRAIFFVSVMSLIGQLANISIASEQEQMQAREGTQEQAYGWELMTPEERTAYRDQMRALKTEEERRAFQVEHHQRMQERAKERGVSPSESPKSQRRRIDPSEDKMGGGGGGGLRG